MFILFFSAQICQEPYVENLDIIGPVICKVRNLDFDSCFAGLLFWYVETKK